MKAVSIKTSFRNIRRSPFQVLAAISVLSITFFVISTLSILAFSSSNILHYFETRPQIIAFMKTDSSEADATALRDKLSTDNRIKKVSYVSKEDAFNIYKNATKDNPLLVELVSPSVFPASVEMTLSDISFASDVVKDVKSNSAVDTVGITASLGGESTLTDVVSHLKAITNTVRLMGLFLVAILTLTSFLVLTVVISMRIVGRREEVEILGLIGATSWFISKPVFIEAVIYSIAGVLIGWLGTLVLLLYTSPTIISYFGDIEVLPHDPVKFFSLLFIILGGELVGGVAIAVFGSIVALGRARKRR